MDKDIDELLMAIRNIIAADGPYKEKIQAILAECDDKDRSNLEEFSAWLAEINFDK